MFRIVHCLSACVGEMISEADQAGLNMMMDRFTAVFHQLSCLILVNLKPELFDLLSSPMCQVQIIK